MTSKTLPRRTITASLLALLALANPTTQAAPRSTTPIDCTRPLLAPGTTHKYDLSPLSSAGPLQISAHYETSPSITSYTLDLSLCSPLADTTKACGSGSRVCQRVSSRPLQGSGDGDEVVNQIIPLYGDSPSFSYEIEDVSRDGREWTLELKGPEYAGVRQKLELEMVCDEGGDAGAGVAKAKWESFDLIEGKRKVSWRTKWACPLKEGGGSGGGESSPDGGETAASRGGWGFFSWFFFLIILGLIIYFVLGTYQNHQQYGVHEIPHRDFWREAPYLVQDAAKHAWKSIAGGSGGGGSSARYEPL